MGEEVEEEGGIPSDAFELAAHRAFRWFQLGEVESEVAQQRQVFGFMVLVIAGVVLVHDHVEDPMQAVFDPPVTADDVVEARLSR